MSDLKYLNTTAVDETKNGPEGEPAPLNGAVLLDEELEGVAGGGGMLGGVVGS